jgi:hypothetical protein
MVNNKTVRMMGGSRGRDTPATGLGDIAAAQAPLHEAPLFDFFLYARVHRFHWASPST